MLALRSKKKELDLNEKNFCEIKNFKEKYILEGGLHAIYSPICFLRVLLLSEFQSTLTFVQKEKKPNLISFSKKYQRYMPEKLDITWINGDRNTWKNLIVIAQC